MTCQMETAADCLPLALAFEEGSRVQAFAQHQRVTCLSVLLALGVAIAPNAFIPKCFIDVAEKGTQAIFKRGD